MLDARAPAYIRAVRHSIRMMTRIGVYKEQYEAFMKVAPKGAPAVYQSCAGQLQGRKGVYSRIIYKK